ncbi:MAG TPA: alpha/beta hydrolase [Thermoanaerobaculia bacterium]|nr:alpha/beta hydrolase [Thermoanaerobaculia bacterium]
MLSKSSNRFVFGALLLGLLLWSPAASAQLQTGNVYGTVTDDKGSPLPGVTVTLTGPGAPQVQITNAQGQFRFLGVSPGSYQLKAELEGFSPIEYPNLVINIGRNTQIEVKLTTSVEDVITVTSESPLLDERRISTYIELSKEKNHTELEVFYGTDRFATGSKLPDLYFSGERSGNKTLSLGVCRVSVPRSHHPGMIEEPSIWRLEFRPDPEKHMVLLDRESLSRRSFYRRMQDTLQKSGKKELMVFVHGFNVSFKDAVLRTAQLATDLRIDGVPVVYSWPSQASFAKYTVDETNAEWTLPHLETFLSDLSQESGASSIYLIAHSMGNRPLTRALERIALKLASPSPKPPFSEILLTAPDIDAEVFADLARSFRRAGQRVTLYASSKDKALTVSKRFNGYRRAGDSGGDIVVMPDVDTVDVSSVDTSLLGFGHSYFGDNCTVLSDIYRLLQERKPPLERGLSPKQKNGQSYWVMQASTDCPH